MPSEKKIKTTKSSAIPTTVSGFAILPLALPPHAGLPSQCASAKHYLYIKPHEPSHPTPTAERSLFISSLPIDANETNLRALFAEQLGGGRVEAVEFDSAVPSVPTLKRFKESAVYGSVVQTGKKRKRDEDIVAEGVVEDENTALPKIWPGELRKTGETAVVVFVDRASMRGAWKAVGAAIKEDREGRWEGAGEEGVVGLNRMFPFHFLSGMVEVYEIEILVWVWMEHIDC